MKVRLIKMNKECKVEYSILTLEITGTRKELNSYMDWIGATIEMEDIKNYNFDITDFCPEHGSNDDLHN